MAKARVLHWIGVGFILAAVGCFLLVPVLGTTLIIVGLGIETIGYFIWGAEFCTGSKPSAPSSKSSSPEGPA